MKLLDGRDLAGFIQQRHSQIVPALVHQPVLAIVSVDPDEATLRYLKVKQHYGDEIGVRVEVFHESAASLAGQIKQLNDDIAVTGIIIQLPLPASIDTDAAVSSIAPAKDIDGLRTDSTYQAATPKAIMWLLAGYNIDVKDRTVAVVGQGRLVGKPLSTMLESAGAQVIRCDIDTDDLGSKLITADIVVAATGQAGLITADMLKDGAVVIDAGSPHSELTADVLERTDITRTPNPGGVGPMTVAALFDNILIAAQAA